MRLIKLSSFVLVIFLSSFAAGNRRVKPTLTHGRWTYNYYVTGIDPLNGNYIVTSNLIACLGPSNVACMVGSTVDAAMVNGNLELEKATCTTLFSAFSY